MNLLVRKLQTGQPSIVPAQYLRAKLARVPERGKGRVLKLVEPPFEPHRVIEEVEIQAFRSFVHLRETLSCFGGGTILIEGQVVGPRQLLLGAWQSDASLLHQLAFRSRRAGKDRMGLGPRAPFELGPKTRRKDFTEFFASL